MIKNQNEKIKYNNIKLYDLIIIGAGWTGIMACKHAIQSKLTVLVVDSRDNIGGMWKYSSENNIKSVMKNTMTSSSKTFNEMSDFPMPLDYPSYPSNKQIFNYLKKYVDNFNLLQHIKLKTWITSVEKINENQQYLWSLKDSNGNKYFSSFLSICTGKQGKPKIPLSIKLKLKDFSGKIIKGDSYKFLTPDYFNKKVLIIGNNDNAAEIAGEIKLYTQKLYWAISDGQWFLPKMNISGDSLDNNLSVLNNSLFNDKNRKGFYFFEDIIELSYGKSGHGIKEWVSHNAFKHSEINKNGDVLINVAHGLIIPKKEIKSIKEKNIIFSDGSITDIDIIILCFNPSINFPFLPSGYNKPIHKNYKYIFNPIDPTLSFLGYIKPNLGSDSNLAELQSMYMSYVYSGKVKLLDSKKMIQVAKRDSKYWSSFFKNQKDYLVDLDLYTQDISKKIGVYPSYTKLFLSSPIKWWKAISAPYNNSRYLLNNNNYHDLIFTNYKQYKSYNSNLMYFIAFSIKPFYLMLRDQLSSKTTNSLLELEDPKHNIKKKKNTNKIILILICCLIIRFVPEWNKIAIDNIIKLAGPLERYESKSFTVVVISIIIFLIYSKK